MDSTKVNQLTTSRTMTVETTQRLTHCKCRIVKLIRGQISRLDKNRELENSIRFRIQNLSKIDNNNNNDKE